MQAWLRAELFLTNFKPVALEEHAVFRGRVYAKLSPGELQEARRQRQQQRRQEQLQQRRLLRQVEAASVGVVAACGGDAVDEEADGDDDAEEEGEAGEEEEEAVPPLREARELGPTPDALRDADRLVPLVAEVVREGHSVLIFCCARRQCESVAKLLADLLPQVCAAAPTLRWCPVACAGALWPALCPALWPALCPVPCGLRCARWPTAWLSHESQSHSHP